MDSFSYKTLLCVALRHNSSAVHMTKPFSFSQAEGNKQHFSCAAILDCMKNRMQKKVQHSSAIKQIITQMLCLSKLGLCDLGKISNRKKNFYFQLCKVKLRVNIVNTMGIVTLLRIFFETITEFLTVSIKINFCSVFLVLFQ